MCLGLCQCLIEFLPYVTVVLLPLFGSFLGGEVVLKVSLLLCLHAAVVSLLPKPWIAFLPYLQAVVFMSLAVCPLLWLPWPLVWLYGLLLALTEPLLLVAEVVLVQNVVMRCGQHLAEKIDDDENASLCKGVIIIFSATCYSLAASGGWELYQNNTSLQNGILLVVAFLFVAVHNMFWMARKGVISDAAFCTLCMVCVLGAMSVETDYIRHPLGQPAQWTSSTSKTGRAVDLVVSVVFAQTGSKGVTFLLKVVVTPFFFLSLALRLYSIIFIVSKITKNFFQNEEDGELTFLDEDELLDPMAAWRSPLLLKLSIIFMLTQMTVLFLWQASGQYMSVLGHWLPLEVQEVWPQQVLMGRVGQVGLSVPSTCGGCTALMPGHGASGSRPDHCVVLCGAELMMFLLFRVGSQCCDFRHTLTHTHAHTYTHKIYRYVHWGCADSAASRRTLPPRFPVISGRRSATYHLLSA